jgi:uncharacterized RDD family membrane protein YckC
MGVEDPMTAAPGWYPDPTGAYGQLRYFDGQIWTEHRAAASPVALQYGAPPARSKTTPDGRPLASWGIRLGAWALDGLIAGVLFAAVLAPLWISVFRGMFDNMRDWMDTHPAGASPTDPFFIYDGQVTAFIWLAVLSVVLQSAYMIGFWRWKQATPGKLILGLRIEYRDSQERLRWSSILQRWLVQYAVGLVYAVGGFFLLLDGLWPLWDAQSQALHEKWPGTNVVRTR